MRAVFCGSFDPLTNGHLDLIRRSSRLADDLYVFVASNSQKKSAYSIKQRLEWLETACAELDNVHIETLKGLAADACRKVNADVLIRGIRNLQDFSYEQNMALVNAAVAPDIETICLFSRPSLEICSSSNVRELLKYNQSIKDYVPQCVFDSLQGDRIWKV